MKQYYFIFCILVIFSSNALASEKKGVGLWDLTAASKINSLNLAWYYTWKPEPIEEVSLAEFIPMIWGGHKLEKQISKLMPKDKVPILLVINEPNHKKQSNMSVSKVIDVWPRMQKLTDSISSPAPAGILTSWFDKFYKQAKKKGIKFDFMAVHIYGSADPVKFLNKVDAVYEKYKMPMWITEFAVADWKAKGKPGKNKYSEVEVLAFMKKVLPELELRPFVKRYAWFGAGNKTYQQEPVRTSRLFDKCGKLTPLGRFYADF